MVGVGVDQEVGGRFRTNTASKRVCHKQRKVLLKIKKVKDVREQTKKEVFMALQFFSWHYKCSTYLPMHQQRKSRGRIDLILRLRSQCRVVTLTEPRLSGSDKIEGITHTIT